MSHRWSQSGEGKLGCVFSLILVLAAVFVAYKMIPVRVKASEFRSNIEDEAKSASMRRGGDAEIRKRLMSRAEDLHLPVDPKNLEISRQYGNIRIEASYTVPVEFPGYTYHWRFHHKAENPLF